MKDKILPTQFLLLVVAFWLSLSNFPFEAYGDASGDVNILPQTACVNCSKCEYPCQQPSPPLSFGTPPPPSPPPSGYSIYDASPPPPPPPKEKGYTKCPPAAPGVQCCTPPAPYTYAPPNPYTYVPYGEAHGSSSSTLLPVLVPLMMLFSSFIFLF